MAKNNQNYLPHIGKKQLEIFATYWQKTIGIICNILVKKKTIRIIYYMYLLAKSNQNYLLLIGKNNWKYLLHTGKKQSQLSATYWQKQLELSATYWQKTAVDDWHKTISSR